jgi:hypothetical protein
MRSNEEKKPLLANQNDVLKAALESAARSYASHHKRDAAGKLRTTSGLEKAWSSFKFSMWGGGARDQSLLKAIGKTPSDKILASITTLLLHSNDEGLKLYVATYIAPHVLKDDNQFMEKKIARDEKDEDGKSFVDRVKSDLMFANYDLLSEVANQDLSKKLITEVTNSVLQLRGEKLDLPASEPRYAPPGSTNAAPSAPPGSTNVAPSAPPGEQELTSNKRRGPGGNRA